MPKKVVVVKSLVLVVGESFDPHFSKKGWIDAINYVNL